MKLNLGDSLCFAIGGWLANQIGGGWVMLIVIVGMAAYPRKWK